MSKVKIHLKTWPKYFQAIKSGEKTFDVRKMDRVFEIGNILVLEEWDPNTEKYTGDSIEVEITYILHGGQWGIQPNNCVIGFKNLSTPSFTLEQVRELLKQQREICAHAYRNAYGKGFGIWRTDDEIRYAPEPDLKGGSEC